MMEKKKSSINLAQIISDLISPNYVLVQSVLFVLHYAYGKTLPKFALWFPSIFYGIIITLVIVISLVILIIGALID